MGSSKTPSNFEIMFEGDAVGLLQHYPLYSLFESMILPQKRFSICLQRCAKNRRSMAGGRVKCYGAFFGSRGVFEFVRKVPWEAHICCKCRLVGKRFST